jgi:hypothetical protein
MWWHSFGSFFSDWGSHHIGGDREDPYKGSGMTCHPRNHNSLKASKAKKKNRRGTKARKKNR